MNMTTLIKNFDNRPLLRAFLFVPLLLTCSALVPQARADCQDACLTNNNSVQGDNALLNLTTGTDNTALGFNALLSNTSGYHNTGIGSQALTSNTVGVDNIAIGWQTLFLTEDGNSNVAIGYQALYQNISFLHGRIGVSALLPVALVTALFLAQGRGRLGRRGIGVSAAQFGNWMQFPSPL